LNVPSAYNGALSSVRPCSLPGFSAALHMAQTTPLIHLTERVEHLLVRHQELQRTNALLQEQLGALTLERDTLRSRLQAARTRIDALLDRLPEVPTAPAAAKEDVA
jgi:cell division protein ZapB